MNQITHIFKKDARHHWIEILLCQAALVTFAWYEVHEWQHPEADLGIASYLPGIVYALLPVSWWITIMRVMQGESPVGDRQFWVTRPYEWKKLLAAKALFILVFLNLPLFCAQVFFLMKAGFAPLPYVPGVLFMQLMLTLVPFVPMVALAAVSRNIGQALLAVLAVVLFLAAMLALSTVVHDSPLSPDTSDWLQFSVLMITCMATIGTQFKRRKTGRARVFLASGPVIIFIIIFAVPYLVQGDSEYALFSGGSNAPFQARLYEKPSPPMVPPDKDRDVEIAIPIVTPGPNHGYLAYVRAARLNLEAADGFQWDSKWQGVYTLFLPGQTSWRQNFTVSYKTFEQMKSLKFKAKISLAVEILQDHDARQIKAGKGEFEIPQAGKCQVGARNLSSIDCRSPLLKPKTLLIQTESGDSTCPLPENKNEGDDEEEDTAASTPPNFTAYAWESNKNDDPAEYGLNPVQSFSLYIWGRDSRRTSVRICPGTPLTLSFPQLVQRARAEFEINQFNLEEYRQEPLRIGFSGFAIRRKKNSK
jgi:hypothetical protein